jgi:hypothetical protein
MEFLGFIFITKGVKIDLKKVEAIQKWPRPKNGTEIQEFLGFVNFYRRFIKGYSGLVTLLTSLIKKDVKFY